MSESSLSAHFLVCSIRLNKMILGSILALIFFFELLFLDSLSVYVALKKLLPFVRVGVRWGWESGNPFMLEVEKRANFLLSMVLCDWAK